MKKEILISMFNNMENILANPKAEAEACKLVIGMILGQDEDEKFYKPSFADIIEKFNELVKLILDKYDEDEYDESTLADRLNTIIETNKEFKWETEKEFDAFMLGVILA